MKILWLSLLFFGIHVNAADYLKISQIYKQNEQIIIKVESTAPCYLETSTDLKHWALLQHKPSNKHSKGKKGKGKSHKKRDKTQIFVFTDNIIQSANFYRAKVSF